MNQLSLRLRLIILFIVISGIFGTISGVFSWMETKEKIDEFFDTYQIALARQLSVADWNALTPQSQKISDNILRHIANADEEDEAIGFAVFDSNGHKIFHDNENGKDFAYLPAVGSYVQQIIDGEKWRIVWVSSADNKYTIAVGQELEYREDIAWEMAEEFLMPWIFGLGALLIMMITVITIEFLPLNKIASDVRRRKEGDLSPLPDKNVPREIRPLLCAMNRLLQQTGEMLQRERCFISDSAHELRTPLAALKVQLEVLEMSAEDKSARQEALQKLSRGIDRSARLVEQLLALSRIETVSNADVHLKDIIDWPLIWKTLDEDYHDICLSKELTMAAAFNGNGPVQEGNPVLCSLLLRNLIDNAVKYSPAGAVIRTEITNGSLKVINSDTHVDEKHFGKLGRRFFRPAGQKADGSGLGISIIQKIAGYYGCSVSFANTDFGFEVTVFRQ